MFEIAIAWLGSRLGDVLGDENDGFGPIALYL